MYEVQRILDHRSVRAGMLAYEVQWVGTKKNGESWETWWMAAGDLRPLHSLDPAHSLLPMPLLTVVCTYRRPLADRRRPRSCATSCARGRNRQGTATASRPPPPASACHSSPAAGCTAAASGSFFVSPPPPPRLPQAIAPGSGQGRQLSVGCGADESRSSLRDGGCHRADAFGDDGERCGARPCALEWRAGCRRGHSPR
jgi:hypothetical protein